MSDRSANRGAEASESAERSRDTVGAYTYCPADDQRLALDEIKLSLPHVLPGRNTFAIGVHDKQAVAFLERVVMPLMAELCAERGLEMLPLPRVRNGRTFLRPVTVLCRVPSLSDGRAAIEAASAAQRAAASGDRESLVAAAQTAMRLLYARRRAALGVAERAPQSLLCIWSFRRSLTQSYVMPTEDAFTLIARVYTRLACISGMPCYVENLMTALNLSFSRRWPVALDERQSWRENMVHRFLADAMPHEMMRAYATGYHLGLGRSTSIVRGDLGGVAQRNVAPTPAQRRADYPRDENIDDASCSDKWRSDQRSEDMCRDDTRSDTPLRLPAAIVDAGAAYCGDDDVDDGDDELEWCTSEPTARSEAPPLPGVSGAVPAPAPVVDCDVPVGGDGGGSGGDDAGHAEEACDEAGLFALYCFESRGSVLERNEYHARLLGHGANERLKQAMGDVLSGAYYVTSAFGKRLRQSEHLQTHLQLVFQLAQIERRAASGVQSEDGFLASLELQRAANRCASLVHMQVGQSDVQHYSIELQRAAVLMVHRRTRIDAWLDQWFARVDMGAMLALLQASPRHHTTRHRESTLCAARLVGHEWLAVFARQTGQLDQLARLERLDRDCDSGICLRVPINTRSSVLGTRSARTAVELARKGVAGRERLLARFANGVTPQSLLTSLLAAAPAARDGVDFLVVWSPLAWQSVSFKSGTRVAGNGGCNALVRSTQLLREPKLRDIVENRVGSWFHTSAAAAAAAAGNDAPPAKRPRGRPRKEQPAVRQAQRTREYARERALQDAEDERLIAAATREANGGGKELSVAEAATAAAAAQAASTLLGAGRSAYSVADLRCDQVGADDGDGDDNGGGGDGGGGGGDAYEPEINDGFTLDPSGRRSGKRKASDVAKAESVAPIDTACYVWLRPSVKAALDARVAPLVFLQRCTGLASLNAHVGLAAPTMARLMLGGEARLIDQTPALCVALNGIGAALGLSASEWRPDSFVGRAFASLAAEQIGAAVRVFYLAGGAAAQSDFDEVDWLFDTVYRPHFDRRSALAFAKRQSSHANRLGTSGAAAAHGLSIGNAVGAILLGHGTVSIVCGRIFVPWLREVMGVFGDEAIVKQLDDAMRLDGARCRDTGRWKRVPEHLDRTRPTNEQRLRAAYAHVDEGFAKSPLAQLGGESAVIEAAKRRRIETNDFAERICRCGRPDSWCVGMSADFLAGDEQRAPTCCLCADGGADGYFVSAGRQFACVGIGAGLCRLCRQRVSYKRDDVDEHVVDAHCEIVSAVDVGADFVSSVTKGAGAGGRRPVIVLHDVLAALFGALEEVVRESGESSSETLAFARSTAAFLSSLRVRRVNYCAAPIEATAGFRQPIYTGQLPRAAAASGAWIGAPQNSLLGERTLSDATLRSRFVRCPINRFAGAISDAIECAGGRVALTARERDDLLERWLESDAAHSMPLAAAAQRAVADKELRAEASAAGAAQSADALSHAAFPALSLWLSALERSGVFGAELLSDAFLRAQLPRFHGTGDADVVIYESLKCAWRTLVLQSASATERAEHDAAFRRIVSRSYVPICESALAESTALGSDGATTLMGEARFDLAERLDAMLTADGKPRPLTSAHPLLAELAFINIHDSFGSQPA
jgi:hypothetical protein